MSFDPSKITFFAQTDARGKQVPFGIKAKDRQRHMYVIGKTGMGKSTMLENMAVQDIQNGEGVAFIDPHGSTAEKLLSYVPKERMDDVVYFAPFDMDYPISFNVMEDVGPDKRHLVVSGLMSTFKKIWVDAWSARMEYILTNTLLALLEYPDSTLLSVSQMLADKGYRRKVVDNIKDPAVRSFWVDEFANYTDRFAAEATPAIQNKIGQFTGNPLIRNIIGQPKSSFDIRQIMDEKKILIMNLSKGLVGETNANLLGSMLTTRIYLAAMSRADLPAHQMKKMPNFYFYVDEFQSFANSTFANILSEARKYHLNLIIAHQYIEQMEEEVKNAVFGNVGTTISFRVGPFDAEVLETVFTPKFVAADLVNLGFAQIYLTLMIDGIGSQPFSATTLPPITEPHISYKDMVVASSRKNYASNRVDVEKQVTSLLTSEQAELSNGRIEREKEKAKARFQDRGSRPNQTDTTRQPRPQGEGMQTTPRGDRGARAPRESSQHRDQQPPRDRTTGQRQKPERRQPGKDLSELRSVLKGMTATETKKEAVRDVAKEKSAAPKRDTAKKDSAAKTDLRSVLSQIAPPNEVKTTDTKPSKDQEETPAKENVQKNVPREGVTPPAQTPAVAKKEASPQKQQHSKPHPQHKKQSTQMPAPHTVQKSVPDTAGQPKVRAPQKTAPPVHGGDRIAYGAPARTKTQTDTPMPAPAPQQTPPAADTSTNSAVQQPEQTGHDTAISPKELERMMRVSTNDKPPFK